MNKIFLSIFFLSFSSFTNPCLAAKFQEKKAESATYYQNFSDDEFDNFESYASVDEVKIYDPLEKYNRKIYAFNDSIDHHFIGPAAEAYRAGIHPQIRNSIRNFLTNLTLPVSAVNSLLQGRIDNSLATFSNFLINSTVGIGGLFDIAGNKGIRYQKEDFGQTLGHYGAGSGAYLILPLLGPSSTRDFTGLATDSAISPIGFNVFEVGGQTNLIDAKYRITLSIASGIDKRESLIDILNDIKKDSFDPYATIRSAYLQKRATEIKH